MSLLCGAPWRGAVAVAIGIVLTGAALGATPLRRVQVVECRPRAEVVLDVGELVASGAVQPRSAVRVDEDGQRCWVLRTPRGPAKLRWPRALLNARPGAPDLTVDPKLDGTYDIYAQVRAVHQGGALGMGAEPDDGRPMAFSLELDDGRRRETVSAKGFPDLHYDTEVLACHRWPLTGRKLVLRSLGRPVYLYGLRFVPSKQGHAAAGGERVTRWLASDHVTVVKESAKHFAFPGAALLANGHLAVVYREGTVHGVERTGKVSLSRSTDGGRTWLPRVTALDRPGRDDRDPSILQLSDGTVLLFAADCVCASSDFGKTWSEPTRTPVFGPKGAVEDEDGHVVYGGLERTVQRELTRIGGRPARLQANSVHRSTDKGRSWTRAGVAAYTVYMPGRRDYIWYDEPFMCVAPGKFWIFCNRVDLDGYARIIRSADRGATWGPIRKTPVWGYPQHLLPLRDGRLLMTYGYRRPPWGVRACLSTDYGKTWDMANEIVLRMDGGTPEGQKRKVIDADLGYPTSLELADGTIFTAYYHNTPGSNCFISATFWTPPGR